MIDETVASAIVLDTADAPPPQRHSIDICFRLDHRGNSFERTVFVIYARGRLKGLIRRNLIKSIDDRPCEQAECSQRAGKSFERQRSHREQPVPIDLLPSIVDRRRQQHTGVHTYVRRQRKKKKKKGFITFYFIFLLSGQILI